MVVAWPPLAALRLAIRYVLPVTFSRNGPYGDSGVAIPRRCLMSMNALFRERDEMSELRGVVYITKTRGQ